MAKNSSFSGDFIDQLSGIQTRNTLITIQLGHYDRDSEVRITMRRSGVAPHDAERIVDIVRAVRGLGVNNHRPTIRACIAIAAIVAHRGIGADPDNPLFISVCQDVLSVDSAKITHGGEPLVPRRIEQLVRKTCAHRDQHEVPRVGNQTVRIKVAKRRAKS